MKRSAARRLPSRQGRSPRRLIVRLAEPVAAIALASAIGAVGIALFSGFLPNHSAFDITLPVAAYAALFTGALGSPAGLISSLVYATPLILAGLGLAVGFRAGVFNIGGQGQFLVGVLGAMAVATVVGRTAGPLVTIPAALISGAVLGGLAGFIPGALKVTSGAHEVVTTIMLNYVFLFLAAWAIKGPLALPKSPQAITYDVSSLNAALPILVGRDGHVGILLAVAAVPFIWLLLNRTTFGFEIRAAGANPEGARYGGMSVRRLVIASMSLSGLMCGLAGATTLLGVVHQLPLGYDTTIGFDAITVALLGQLNPIGVCLAGLLLGAMRSGSQAMQIQAGVPADLVDALQAIILLFLVINVLRRFLRRRSPAQPVYDLTDVEGVPIVDPTR